MHSLTCICKVTILVRPWPPLPGWFPQSWIYYDMNNSVSYGMPNSDIYYSMPVVAMVHTCVIMLITIILYNDYYSIHYKFHYISDYIGRYVLEC